jgi:kynurenine formamidase
MQPREMHDSQSPRPEEALRKALLMLRVHDASPPIENGMPMFVAFEGPQIVPIASHHDVGIAANRVTMVEHTGTHIDAPFHFARDGLTIDRVAPDALFLRPYKKLDLKAEDPQPGELLGADALRRAVDRAGVAIDSGDVVIIEMGWDRFWPTEPGDHTHDFWGLNMPGLSADACEYLVGAGVVAVASDTAACDTAVRDGDIGAGDGHRHWFLPKGLLIVEGLQGLAQVPATGLFVAIPLRLAGGTASPARVLLLFSDS